MKSSIEESKQKLTKPAQRLTTPMMSSDLSLGESESFY